jgi:hypothetical protein
MVFLAIESLIYRLADVKFKSINIRILKWEWNERNILIRSIVNHEKILVRQIQKPEDIWFLTSLDTFIYTFIDPEWKNFENIAFLWEIMILRKRLLDPYSVPDQTRNDLNSFKRFALAHKSNHVDIICNKYVLLVIKFIEIAIQNLSLNWIWWT